MSLKEKRLDKIFVIFDTQEQHLWNSNRTKIGWISEGAAKNAWSMQQRRNIFSDDYEKILFDEQSRYVIVTITEEKILKLMKESGNV